MKIIKERNSRNLIQIKANFKNIVFLKGELYYEENFE